MRTPAKLKIGRTLRLPLDILKPPVAPNTQASSLAPKIAERQQKTKSYTDKRRRARKPQFRSGDWVRVKCHNRSHKLASSLSQPRQISRRFSPHTFKLNDGTRWNTRRLVPTKPPVEPSPDTDPLLSFPMEDLQPPAPRRSQRIRCTPRHLQDYDCS